MTEQSQIPQQCDSPNIRYFRPERLIPNAGNRERVLSYFRGNFLLELMVTNFNNIASQNLRISEQVLDITDGTSKLADFFLGHGIPASKVAPREIRKIPIEKKYGITTSFNLLETFHELPFVTLLLDAAARVTEYGMVHQIHTADDLGFLRDTNHRLNIGRHEWEHFFVDWSVQHEGWRYLGSHQGTPGRPRNFVLDKNKSLDNYPKIPLRKLFVQP